MNRIFRNDNKISRIIAFLIAFVMILSPFFAHAGIEKDTRAAGVISIVNADVIVSGEGYFDGATNYMPAMGIVKNVYICGDTAGFNIAVDGEFDIGEDVNRSTYTVNAYSVKYLKNPSDVPDEYITEVTDGVDSVDDAVNNDKVYVYVKPTSVYDAEGNEVTTTDTYGYTLMAVYTIIRETDALSNACWVDSSDAEITAEYVKYAKLSTGLPEDVLYADTIKYIVKPADEGMPSSVEWNTASVMPVSINTEGEYAGYIAMYADGATEPTVVKTLAEKIKIDTTAPAVTKVVLQKKVGADWNNVDADDITDGIIYEDSTGYIASNYRYVFYVEDTDGSVNSGIDMTAGSVYMKDKDSNILDVSCDNGVFYRLLDSQVTDADYWDAIVVDKAGNKSSSVRVSPSVKVVDKTLRVSSETWYDGSKVSDGVVFSDTYVNKPYTIKYSVTSGYPIDAKVTITANSQDTVISKEDLGGNDEYSNGIYSYNFSYVIPSVSVDQVIDNVRVVISDGVSADKTDDATGFTYDCTSPVVSNSQLQYYDDESGKWVKVTEGIDTDKSYFINHVTDNRQYRYYLKVTDETSPIASVKAYTNAECSEDEVVFTNIAGTNYYYYEFTQSFIESIPDLGLSMYVKAEDIVGNTSMSDGEGKLITPTLKLASNDISLKLVSVKNQAGDIIDLTENKYYNEPIKITLKASSGYRISKMYINDGSEYSKSFSSTYPGNDEIDAYTKRYEIEYTFEIPGDNQELIGMVAYVEDTGIDGINGVQSAGPVTIGDLFYDATKPKAQLSANTTNWTNSPKISYSITSGEAAVESSINTASYDVMGAVSNSLANPLTVKADGTVSGALNKNAIPESADITGTKLIFTAKDLAGNQLAENNTVTVKCDMTSPKIDRIIVSGIDTAQLNAPIKGDIKLAADVSDNLTLSTVVIRVTDPNNRTYVLCNRSVNAEQKDISRNISADLTAYDGSKKLVDGVYKVAVIAKDKASNSSAAATGTFTVDNTIPVVFVNVTSGTVGGKSPRKNADGTDYDYYMKSDVGVRVTCKDDNIKSVTVTDNGNAVDVAWQSTGVPGEYIADMVIKGEGRHTIKVNAVDMSGSEAVEKSVEFIKDTGVPVVTTTINSGLVYTESMGQLDLTNDSTVAVSVSDMCVDDNDLNYQIIKKAPDQPEIVGKYAKTSTKNFGFSDEADYTFNVYAADMANNQSAVRSVRFRIDKTAPAITINGASGGGTSANAATVTFNMKEAFWWDASGTVTIYRKAGDGSEEALLKTIDYKPTAFETNVSESLTETGVYRMEFTASDRAGHTATTSQTFTIDREAPEITLNGVNNYDVTDKTVDFRAEVKDDFYSSKKVIVTGTRTDIEGKVNSINFSAFNPSANPTTILESFTEDGIYDIEVTSTDVAGNSHSASVHFTIDKSAPVIGDLSLYDGMVLREFKWNSDLDELVSDLTVCDIHMYLNGSEYDGVSDIKDGSYVLLITAEDELGHYVEKSVSFVLDTKAPVFIVTGVEDGEVKNEAYAIGISLQLEEDTLESVTLNGKAVTVNNNAAALDVTEKGEYTLSMTAVDEAGNIAEETIEFRFGEEFNWWIWLIIAICVLLIAGVIIIVIAKKRKRNK